mgnify:CR=1 FL=1
MQPTTEKESATSNALIGASLGAGGSAALSGIGKTVNAFKQPVKNATQNLANRFGIRTTLGEVTGNPHIEHAETLLEKVPVLGLRGYRKKQNDEAQAAAKTFFSKYIIDPTADTTSDMKVANDTHIDALYESMKKAARKDLPSVPAPTVKKASSDLQERFPSVFESIQDTHLKKILKNITGDVIDKTHKTGILDASGKEITRKVTPEFSFDDLWALRKGIGKEMKKSLREGNDTAHGAYSAIYEAVSRDMDTMFASSKTGVGKEFREANEAFKQYSLKFDAIRKAYDKAAGTTGAGEIFSPKKFSTELKNLANNPDYKKNVKWSANEIEEMTGLANILQTVKRAGQYKENPPTGNRLGMPIAAEVAGVAGVAKAVPYLVVARFLSGTEAGKRLALAASKIDPKSPAMKGVMAMVYQQAAKMPAIAATGE